MNLSDLVIGSAERLGAELAAMSWLEIAIAIICISILLYTFAQLWTISEREQRLAFLKHIEPLKHIEAPALQESKLDLSVVASPPWYDRLGTAIASTMFVGPADCERLKRALANAGLHDGNRRLATLIAAKLGSFAIAVLGTWLTVTFYGFFGQSALVRLMALFAAALVGWRVPDLALAHLARRRRQRIEGNLPDALDLLVICAEAGLSFEQGIEFVAREMSPVMIEIGEEFSIMSAELRVLGDRREALQNFANRINLPAVRSIVATLVQTMRYGTPLAQSLRLLAAEMRRARLLNMEARAARLPVMLTMPLMGCILPSLMMVVGGPAIITVMSVFGSMAK
jgi:tight adherence protein C